MRKRGIIVKQSKSYQGVLLKLVRKKVLFFFLNDGGSERLHVKGQAVWEQLIKNSCIAAGLQFEVSCPQFMASFITAIRGENVVFGSWGVNI